MESLRQSDLANLHTSSIGLIAFIAISGCSYSPPEASGLAGVRPYPNDDDVCQIIGENALSNQYLDHTSLLVGCPAHETGAISDRIREGGVQLDQIGDWVLFSIPN